MKKRLLLLFLVLPFLTLAQIGTKTQQAKIFGTWINTAFGYQMTLTLNENGSGEFDGGKISFTTQNYKLTITSQGKATTYNYILQGNSLTLSGGDLQSPISFTLQSSTKPVVLGQQSPSSTTSTLVGKWTGNGETIEFTNAGQCLYFGQSYPYTVSGEYITLQTMQGNLLMGYAVKGNQLSLIINEQTLLYTKGGDTNSPTSTTTGKRVAPELVGKWCYVNVSSSYTGSGSTEQCITLNANGTYEYYGETSRNINTGDMSGGTASQQSDRGTWSYDGSRIYYTSSQGAGSGSYLLEKRNHPKNNDPMIVLDGVAYVTYYQKAPWK